MATDLHIELENENINTHIVCKDKRFLHEKFRNKLNIMTMRFYYYLD